eukprot:g1837.t1
MPKNKKKRKANLTSRSKELKKKHLKYQQEQKKLKNKEYAHEQRIKKYKRSIAKVPYKYNDQILLVGEGNFSFALGLVRYFKKLKSKHGSKSSSASTTAAQKKTEATVDASSEKRTIHDYGNIYATSYDSEEQVYAKYPEARDIISELKQNGVHVVHGVDATNLSGMKHLTSVIEEAQLNAAAGNGFSAEDVAWDINSHAIPPLERLLFNHIVFNFPHTGCGIKDTLQNNRHHQKFLTAFFKSCVPLLARNAQDVEYDRPNYSNRNGQIHVTLKKGEPYDSWAVPRVARLSVHGLKLRTQQDFYPELYKGYEHRRTVGGLVQNDEGESNNSKNNCSDSDGKIEQLANKDISKIGARTYIFQVVDENEEKMRKRKLSASKGVPRNAKRNKKKRQKFLKQR